MLEMVQRSYQNRFLKAAHVIKELIDLIIDEILQTIAEELVATVLLTGQC
jgi:hypothetical protein